MMQSRPAEVWQFELYVTGDDQRSATTLENFKGICHDYLNGNCCISVFDVSKNPGLIAEKGIAVAPILIKKYPLPEKMLVGDLSATHKVLEGLGLNGSRAKPAGANLYHEGLRKQGRKTVPSTQRLSFY